MFKVMVSFLLMSSLVFAGKINISVAANVSYAIEELKAEFIKTNLDTQVIVILGSSGKLAAQIKNGAPYGLFMSADMKYPQTLFDDKIAITRPIVYARGGLAYLSAKEQDFSAGMQFLKNKNIRKIAIANPRTAPYGKASIEAMKNAKVYEQVKDKFVFAESISQTVSYAVTAADIGLISKSSLYSSKMKQYKENVNWMSIDESLYTSIEQGIVLLKYAQGKIEYQAFYDFILSSKGKKILQRYGYTF